VNILERIDSPEDLRQLDPEHLQTVVDEIRELLLQVVSEKGGHLASNLGSVELTVGLHYVFDTPRDKIVWDVGHQAYGHKILTGRRDRFHTIRQFEGLSGFTSRSESEYDHFGAGHASTSISAALGIAEALRHQKLPHMSIAVIGDGSLTGGLVYEAMNNAGHIPARNLLVVFNDNEMSIDPNVGALSKFINQAVTHPGYNRLRRELRSLILSLADHGVPLAGIADRARKSIKNFFTPGMLFECFGFRYFGPINGHDIHSVVESLEFIKQEGPENGPYLLHTLTTKGKGYKLAEDNPRKYHGVNPFKRDEGLQATTVKKPNYQDVFADTLIDLAKKDERIIAITAAMPSGTGLVKFQKQIPKRFYDVGIAESHAVLFAAGLATEGFRPVAAIYSTFLQRAYDQIIHDVCLQKLPVIFAMDRAGLVGADGATHQGAFDISYLRAIPNMIVMAPKDENELRHMLKTAVDYMEGPVAIRYPRGEVVGVVCDQELKFIPIGEAELLSVDSEQPEVVFVAVGSAVQQALEAKELVQDHGYTTCVINARYIKPLDEKLLLQWIKHSKLIVTVEEHTVCGGFGSSVLEMLSRNQMKKDSLVLGMPDRFIDHASPKIQKEFCLLDGPGIARQCVERLNRLGAKALGKRPTKEAEIEAGILAKH
jgi:1-deoxy-D-xylulose-5-phosphate synthase